MRQIERSLVDRTTGDRAHDTGVGSYTKNFPASSPRTVTLYGHPTGSEFWTAGAKTLEVHESTLLRTGTLTVTN